MQIITRFYILKSHADAHKLFQALVACAQNILRSIQIDSIHTFSYTNPVQLIAAMNTRRGRAKSTSTAASSSTAKSNPPTVRPRGNRRNGLHNITNTKSDETNSDPIVEEPISLDSTDEGEQETVADQLSTEKPTNKRLQSPASVPTGSPAKKRRSKADEDAVSTELALFKAIRETLSKHYFDVVTRLQLNFVPSCTTNLEYCSTFHNKDGVWKEICS